MHPLYVLMIFNNLKLYNIAVNWNEILIDSLWKIKVAKQTSKAFPQERKYTNTSFKTMGDFWGEDSFCALVLAECLIDVQYHPTAGLLKAHILLWSRSHPCIVEEHNLFQSIVNIFMYKIKWKNVFNLTHLANANSWACIFAYSTLTFTKNIKFPSCFES